MLVWWWMLLDLVLKCLICAVHLRAELGLKYISTLLTHYYSWISEGNILPLLD